jgi:hypothetical protein
MNDTLYKKVLSNKALFEKFLPKVTFPKTIIRNMDGLFYDNNYNLIFTDEAEKILKKHTEVVFKPTLESGGREKCSFGGFTKRKSLTDKL